MYKFKMQLLLIFISLPLFARAPQWVNELPNGASSYNGRAVVTKDDYGSREEYMKAAETQALRNISSAISVVIEGATQNSYLATSDSQTSTYQEEIKSYTQADLEGFEFVEEWESRKEYWVYYKLDKAVWRSIEQRRLREGEARAESFIANANTFLADGKVVSAIRSYTQAFGEILPILYLDPKTTTNGSTIPLVAHIDERMVTLLNQLQLEVNRPFYSGTYSSYNELPSEIQFHINRLPVNSFPIILNDNQYFSNSDGTVPVSVQHIEYEQGMTEFLLPIATDIDALIPTDLDSEIVKQWLYQLNWPSATAQFVFKKPAVYVEALQVGYNDLPYEQLENAVEERLGDIGYSIARFPEEAEYRVMVSSEVRPAGSMGNLYFSYVDINWVLFNKSGDQLMTNALDPIKGGALSYDDANVKAYLKGKNILADSIINWMQENQQ